MSEVRFTSFPLTEPPPAFAQTIVSVFKKHERLISTLQLEKGLDSDSVMKIVADELRAVGFEIEGSKSASAKLGRPVFFGENGSPSLRYEIDGYHPDWRCGIEIEAGRAIHGNAIFRDLFQAMVMVDVDHLCLAVPLLYKYKAKSKLQKGNSYAKTVSVASALYGHSRVSMPYGLTVIGY
jgi:hypothetical protein